jgi:hypothetical protein
MDDGCDVTSRWLTGQHTLYLCSPSKERVEISNSKEKVVAWALCKGEHAQVYYFHL